MMTTVNTYVYRALDAYPYEMETVMEALEMAFAYDESNVMALHLMGRVHAEILKEYEAAIGYYEKVLAEDPTNVGVHYNYVLALLYNQDYDKALVFIDYAFTIKGADKAELYLARTLTYEYMENYEEALKWLKLAPRYAYNNEFYNYCQSVKARIEKKFFTVKKEVEEEKEANKEERPTKVRRFGFLF